MCIQVFDKFGTQNTETIQAKPVQDTLNLKRLRLSEESRVLEWVGHAFRRDPVTL